jgi:5-(carboxyamino)imidazole ribonucleotide synthase
MSTLAILGGGQLARMTAYAAYRLGFDVGVVARPEGDSPALKVASHRWVGNCDDGALLAEVARHAHVVTLENEFVAPSVLVELERLGVRAAPSGASLSTVQDKFRQKTALSAAGLPVPRFAAVDCVNDVLQWGQRWAWPLMLKSRRNGYDGHGNALLRSPDDVSSAWDHLGQRSNLMVEECVPFTRELAVMVARNERGDQVVYPVVETVQQAHMCHTVLAPANVSSTTALRAQDLATQMMQAVGGIGVFGLELFLLADGELLINEVAPRPHNSGHFSMDACATSQFENHVRAIMGLPLGSAAMTVPAAAMVNVLGGKGVLGAELSDLQQALAIPGVRVHLYGKVHSRPGRKMGHVTVVGKSADEACATALKAARCLSV